jgi:hypothetical protein
MSGSISIRKWAYRLDENKSRLAKDGHQECGTDISLIPLSLEESLPLLCSPLFQLPQDDLIRRLVLLGITARSRLVPTLQMNFNILIVLIDDGMFRPSRSPRLSLLVRRGDGRSSPSAPTG